MDQSCPQLKPSRGPSFPLLDAFLHSYSTPQRGVSLCHTMPDQKRGEKTNLLPGTAWVPGLKIDPSS